MSLYLMYPNISLPFVGIAVPSNQRRYGNCVCVSTATTQHSIRRILWNARSWIGAP